MIQLRKRDSGEHPELSLLTGEDLDTNRPQEAARWVRIYSELLALNEERGDAGRRVLELLRGRLEEWRRRHLELAGLEFDPYARILTVAGRALHLTRREAQLMDWLLDHPGQFFTSEALIQEAWEDARLAPEQVRTYVVRLRRKLEEARAPARLVNRARLGYALDVDPAAGSRGRGRPAS
jgi:DNA-binding winged helix-turn-helix (wHTH) protein